MFVDRLTIDELRLMLEPHMKRCAWPGLDSALVKARARRYARKYGLWKELEKAVGGQRDIPVLRRSAYRRFRRTGDRDPQQQQMFGRMRQTQQTALALWLDHPAAHVDDLQDLLWAWCDTWTWVMAAHEAHGAVDLAATAIAGMLAEIVAVLDDRLEDEVKDRVKAETRRRVLEPAVNPLRPAHWWTVRNNWNHVCNANLIITALYLLDHPHVLAGYIHPLIGRLGYAIDGFADDGGCLEGPGYWDYGFGHFLDAAVALHHRTGGKLNLMDHPKIRRICEYPLAAVLEGPHRTTFADARDGYFHADNALKINRFFKLPQLYTLVPRHGDRSVKFDTWRALALVRQAWPKAPQATAAADYWLPDLGQAVLRTARGSRRAVLAALAGHNGVPHNHNDVGSFIYLRGGHVFLTDPGAPRYTAKTFGPRRYEILLCRSRGHCVPVINGREQAPGSRYRGRLSVQGLNTAGAKAAEIEMTAAYADKTLTALQRRLELDARGGLTIRDRYEFSRTPRSLEEAFVTWQPAAVLGGRRAVRIGSGPSTVTLTAGTPGRLVVECLQDDDPVQRDGRILTRIALRPAQLTRAMTLLFVLR